MNEIETAFVDLKLQQENTQNIQVNRIFANEIVLQIFGTKKEASNCSKNLLDKDSEPSAETYYIYEDAKHQLITVESP